MDSKSQNQQIFIQPTLSFLISVQHNLIIYVLRKDIGVGGWFRKWQFPHTLCNENVLTLEVGWFKKASKHPYDGPLFFLRKFSHLLAFSPTRMKKLQAY